MNKDNLKDMRELESVAEKAGGYVSFLPSNEKLYDYKKMIKYCKEKGISPLDLTIREYNSFAIN